MDLINKESVVHLFSKRFIIYRCFQMRWQCGQSAEWQKFKRNNPKAKLVLIDLVPNRNVQVKDDKDVLNVGGFSDNVFEIISNFVKGNGDHFVEVIKNTEV